MSAGRADQLALALGPYENRQLFSDHFLTEVLPTWPEFAAAPAAELLADLAALWRTEREGLRHANEAQTEERFIKPVLERLGFKYTVQPALAVGGRRRQPDYALFADDETREVAAQQEGGERFRGAVAVCDAKKFDRPLDRRRVEGALSEDPEAQIIHYVAVTRCRWGILTNGRLWRLYAAEGDLVEGACLEFDLIGLLEAGELAPLRWFAALATADAFRPGADGRSLTDRALDGSRAQAVAVGDALQRQVFFAVPVLAEGLLRDEERTSENLLAAFDHALVLLYRLLFCLHAEDRGLLPVDNEHYRSYSLRRQRENLASAIDHDRVFSSQSDDLFNDLRALFRIVDKGDPALGVNEYNGGLFSADAHPWLRGRWVADDRMAKALDLLYRVGGHQVDYKDLAVRHLGTIFEQLLAFRLEDAGEGFLRLGTASGRKETGAWFTPDHIVDEIVERTLAPLIDARSQAGVGQGLKGEAMLGWLLGLRVLDPAMGSGHFLVGAAAYIARRIANDPSYEGELTLADLRGVVAERCLYGVDINPMAVEVAQLAMWLTTLRNDRPLRFLGNLRYGNSLVGAELAPLLEGGGTLFADELAGRARSMLDQVRQIVSIDARSGTDAHEKERIARLVEETRRPLLRACDEVVAPAVSPEAGRPFHWEVEFPEVFLDENGRLRPDAGFDALIGNPPYVRIQAMGRDVAEYCRQNYATASGSFDAYVPFLERGVRLLHGAGRLGFIVPNKFLKLDYATRLRAFLSRAGLVDAVLDFGHAQVFGSATNYTCVLVLHKTSGAGFAYHRYAGTEADVRRQLTSAGAPASVNYRTDDFGAGPWLLAAGQERSVIEAMRQGSEPLGEVVERIITGLQTSADDVYLLEDLGPQGALRRVRSRDGRTWELEPELLHSLASGADVERFCFRTLRTLILFPYVARGASPALVDEHHLRSLSQTWGYLRHHEATLRGRERGRMDKDGWWAYVYPKSLDAQEQPKLGVPRMCARLRGALDTRGEVYLDNVDVNGVLARLGGPSLAALLLFLNSNALDFIFRRSSVPFRGGYWSANKQFIAPLPIPSTIPDEADEIGQRLEQSARGIEHERSEFRSWLSSVIGVPGDNLSGSSAFDRYENAGIERVLAVLDANESKLTIDPRARTHRDLIRREYEVSSGRLEETKARLTDLSAAAELLVYDTYGISAEHRAYVDADCAAVDAQTAA